MEFPIVVRRCRDTRTIMLGLRVAAALCVAAAFCAVPSGNAASADAGEVEKGRALAERLCAACHMNEGQGEKQGPLGVPGFAAVAARPQQSHDGIVRWLQSRPPMMPDHHLSSDESGALAMFILSLRNTP